MFGTFQSIPRKWLVCLTFGVFSIFEVCSSDGKFKRQADNSDALGIDGDYLNYAKYLLVMASNYSLPPDRVACTDIDPKKDFIMEFEDKQGIRVCDICPTFPFTKFKNLLVNVQPMEVHSNVPFSECFGACVARNECVAYSYDHESVICYTFNSTIGKFHSESNWTTVLMNQPTGIINHWIYSRHTVISSSNGTSPLQTSTETSFLNCLSRCQDSVKCKVVSYTFASSSCLQFTSVFKDSGNYVDFKYGVIAAFDLESVNAPNDNKWRFIEETQIASNISENEFQSTSLNTTSKCPSPGNDLGAFYSMQCLTMEALGCDSRTGCQSCYYPEKTNSYRKDLIICPDSTFVNGRNQKEKLITCYNECVGQKGCIAVDFNPSQLTCNIVMHSAWRPKDPSDNVRRFTLTFSKLLPNLAQFSILPKRSLELTTGSNTQKEEMLIDDLDKCLAACIQRPFCTKVAYSKTKQCRMTSTSSMTTDVQSANADSNVYIKKPNLISPLLAFQQMPGWRLAGKSKETEEYGCGGKDCSDQLLRCTDSCLIKFSKWCNILSIDYGANKVICNFFNGTEDTDLVPSQSSEVFTKIFQTDFSLQNLNSRDAFEEKDFYNCFTNSSTSATLSDVAGYDAILYDNGNRSSNNNLLTRRKRGFFSAIGNFFKKAVQTVVNVVKDTVKTVVDTAKGVVKTVGKVIQGDFNGAKDAFLNIPIVKDVKEAGENVIKIGKSVVAGDWAGVGDAALGLATSNLVDFIPGVGKVAKIGGKALKDAIGKGAKKGGKDVGKGPKTEIGDQASKDRINRNDNNKPDKDRSNNDENRNEPDRCKRANTRSKPGTSSSCNNQNLKCYKPNIEHVMGISLRNCGMKKEGESCYFFCEPGYMEMNRGKTTCESTPKSSKADWKPPPKCTLVLCSRVSKFHTIPVEVPADLGRLPDRVAYVSYYDEDRRLPVWSVALHDIVNQGKGFSRKAVAGFAPHPCSIKQATAAEYKSSGWHQGHLTPINVMLYHQKAAKASNLFINIAPQSPTINTGAWKTLEMKVQCFTRTVTALVATGICHGSLSVTLPPGNLEVPSCFWKMLCYRDKSSKTMVVGFVGPNEKLSKTDLDKRKKARESIFTPRSQKYIKDFVSGGDRFYMGSATSDPWLISAKSIYGSASPTNLNVVECSAATALDADAEKEWKDRLAPKAKSGRRKRGVSGSGCSIEDEEELAALFGIDDFDQDENEIDNPNETEEDSDGNGGGGKFAGASCGKRLIGYYPSWGDKKITFQQANRLTHVVYAFFETKSDGSIALGSADPTHSPDPGSDTAVAQNRLAELMKIAKASSNLQVMFAVGGWENSQYFSSIAANPNSRMNFIANVIKIIQEHSFDGIDIDWEYPVTGGAQEGVPSDKENYVQLMKELRQILDQHQKQIGRADPFLISFAGAAGQWTLDPGFDLPGLLQYASWVNVMTYDYFGAWGSKWGAYTGPPAPLYFAMPPRFSGKTNVDWTVKYYVCRTNQPHKINMGVPFYGRFWRNVGAPIDPTDNMWRTAEQVGGKFDGGYEPWRKLKVGWLNDPSFQKSFHDKAKAPYAFNAAQRIFLGYEDPQSLKFKVDYAAEHNLGGLMIWAIDQDDDQNTMLNTLVDAPLCKNTDPKAILYKCSPITDKRWWTSEDGDDVAGLCGRSAPLYKGYYPVCDPDDPGYSCCGAFGYCGTGDDYCKCSTCVDYRNFPERILGEPVRPSVPVQWYFLNAEDGKRGRCGRDIPKMNNEFPICNPDDDNAHCCSNGGYCGSKPEHCQCSGCIDFKVRKDYRYGPRKWWIVADGQDKAGKCGPKAPLINGAQAECNPDDPGFHCCSPSGFCGNGAEYCNCQGCVDFKKR